MGGVKVAFLEAIAAVVPVALVYFSGWAYLSSYVGAFGIDATQLDVGFPTVLVYAFPPLQSWTLLIFAIIVIGVAALVYKFGVRTQLFWWPYVVVLLVSALFVISYVAKESANEMAENVWRGKKVQAFANVSSGGPSADQYKLCQSDFRLHQIIGLANRLFLLCRSALTPCDRGVMYVINDDGRIIYTANEIRRDVNARQICTD
ncbi:hypothetical protein [Mesorhizobium sp. B2-8-5]|uniref:hypothetical protein n=1 Tax=Mesorhizobium sp. B2-8-5 TaxID=2589903 RepID=UPI0011260D94|nr:hypothetical protein [Mesorhizobium sp. B2-8-5]UCI23995.1 hypothetical protein FJ430_20575 [Mesorhizobium sp. B2-8-5]